MPTLRTPRHVGRPFTTPAHWHASAEAPLRHLFPQYPSLSEPSLIPIEIHLSHDVQAKLSRLADARGSDSEMLASESMERFVDYDDWFVREVEKGLTQVERANGLSHAEVKAWLEKNIAEKQSRS